MPLEVRHVESTDFEDIAAIDDAAMGHNGITRVIGIAVAVEGKSRKEFFLEYIRSSFETDRETFWKVIDTETGEMISLAKYTFRHKVEDASPKQDDATAEKERDGAVTDEAIKPATEPPSALQQTMMKLFGHWQEFSKEHIQGKPHATTHPKHQRRGAATLLLQKGAKAADEAGLDTFLQASIEGTPAYIKAGFQVIRTDNLDLTEFGIEEVSVRRCMIRPFSKKN